MIPLILLIIFIYFYCVNANQQLKETFVPVEKDVNEDKVSGPIFKFKDLSYPYYTVNPGCDYPYKPQIYYSPLLDSHVSELQA
jgi:hypothetical protein